MKTTIAVCSAAIMLFAVTFRTGAEIIAGPITNPANGHDYYLLAPESWPAAEAEAENLGGTLVIIRNADEQKWIFAKFGHDGDKERSLWIGLHRQWQGGPFIWMDGSRLDYANWCSGQPDNGGGVENCVHMWADAHNGGGWNDAVENTSLYAVVEVPGKSDEKALTEKEKSLIGAWYNNGDPDQPCWIAGTDNLLFAIDQNKDASRAIYTTEGLLFSPKWKQHAEIVKDKILWSRGNWWSRKPAEYKTNGKSFYKNASQLPSSSMTDETAK
jgi:hypothetical protein